MFLKIIFSTLFLLSIFGCSNREFNQIFSEDRLYSDVLVETKKSEIVKELHTEAVIVATYLNNLFSDYSGGGEHFFVGVLIDKDFDDENKSGLFNPFYKLKLNDKEAISISKVNSESELYKKMPNISRWLKYYIVTFDGVGESRMKLNFEHKESLSTSLHFQKQ